MSQQTNQTNIDTRGFRLERECEMRTLEAKVMFKINLFVQPRHGYHDNMKFRGDHQIEVVKFQMCAVNANVRSGGTGGTGFLFP